MQLFVGTALVSAVKRIVDLSIGDITADKATGVSAEEIPGDKGDKVLVSSFLQLPINTIIDIAIIGNTFVSFIGFCFSL